MGVEIAVLIPVYQNQDGVLKSLRSLRDATWPGRGTIILVDDGSNPALHIRAEDWAPLTIALVRLSTNQGVEVALNTGLEYALKGGFKYLARLDAGDTVHKDRMTKQIAIMEADGEVGIVGSDVNFEAEDGRALFRFVAPLSDGKIRRTMHMGLCLIDPAVTFRASDLGTLGGYSTAYRMAEGYEIAFRMLAVSRARSIPEALTNTTLETRGLSVTRRCEQLKSRFRVQLRYFDKREIRSYIGVAVTVILFVVPRAAVLNLKRMFGKSRI